MFAHSGLHSSYYSEFPSAKFQVTDLTTWNMSWRAELPYASNQCHTSANVSIWPLHSGKQLLSKRCMDEFCDKTVELRASA